MIPLLAAAVFPVVLSPTLHTPLPACQPLTSLAAATLPSTFHTNILMRDEVYEVVLMLEQYSLDILVLFVSCGFASCVLLPGLV